MLVIFENFFFVYELYLIDIVITDFQTRHESLSLRLRNIYPTIIKLILLFS